MCKKFSKWKNFSGASLLFETIFSLKTVFRWDRVLSKASL